MNYHDQGLILDHLFEIQKQRAFEEAEEPVPEPEKRATTVTKLTAGHDVTEGFIKVSEDVDSKEQRAAATGQGIMGMFDGYEETVIEKKKCLSRHFQGLDHRLLFC